MQPPHGTHCSSEARYQRVTTLIARGNLSRGLNRPRTRRAGMASLSPGKERVRCQSAWLVPAVKSHEEALDNEAHTNSLWCLHCGEVMQYLDLNHHPSQTWSLASASGVLPERAALLHLLVSHWQPATRHVRGMHLNRCNTARHWPGTLPHRIVCRAGRTRASYAFVKLRKPQLAPLLKLVLEQHAWKDADGVPYQCKVAPAPFAKLHTKASKDAEAGTYESGAQSACVPLANARCFYTPVTVDQYLLANIPVTSNESVDARL